MRTLSLFRFDYGDDGTFGLFVFDDGTTYYTVEQPWRDNQVGHSCIPEGNYPLKKRASGVVQRTSGGTYSEGWEVTGVPGRTYIMIHPANWPTDVEGCIGPGLKFGTLSDRRAVTSSRDAFDHLMDKLNAETDGWQLQVTSVEPPK